MNRIQRRRNKKQAEANKLQRMRNKEQKITNKKQRKRNKEQQVRNRIQEKKNKEQAVINTAQRQKNKKQEEINTINKEWNQKQAELTNSLLNEKRQGNFEKNGKREQVIEYQEEEKETNKVKENYMTETKYFFERMKENEFSFGHKRFGPYTPVKKKDLIVFENMKKMTTEKKENDLGTFV